MSGHMASDHVHMCVSIPPKYAVSEVIGYLKGKSAISQYRCQDTMEVRIGTLTVSFELEKVNRYIVQQEKLEKDQEDGKF